MSLDRDPSLKNIEKKEQSPVVQLVNKIIFKGIKREASAIHFEPQKDFCQIRFLQDGILVNSANTLNRAVYASVLTLFKQITETENNKAGKVIKNRFTKVVDGEKYNFWVDFLPTNDGVELRLRWWNLDEDFLDLRNIIDRKEISESITKLVSIPEGLLLIIGPEYSGKSTLLYSLLLHKRNSGCRVATLEEKQKYRLADVKQIELKSISDEAYYKKFSYLLEGNNEVILLDRIPGKKTALKVMEAAQNNCLILTGLKSSDPANAIAQLLEIGINPQSIAKSLKGIIHRRLLRKVCPSCRIQYQPLEMELNRFGLNKNLKISLYSANNSFDNNCSYCQGIGYKGQIPIYGLLPINQLLQGAISQNLGIEGTVKISQGQGMKNLLDSGLDLVTKGETTLAEIERVLPDILDNYGISQDDDSDEFSPENSLENQDRNNQQLEAITEVRRQEKTARLSEEELMMRWERKLTDKYEKRILELEEKVRNLTLELKQIKELIELDVLLESSQERQDAEELELSEFTNLNDLSKQVAEALPKFDRTDKPPNQSKKEIEDPW